MGLGRPAGFRGLCGFPVSEHLVGWVFCGFPDQIPEFLGRLTLSFFFQGRVGWIVKGAGFRRLFEGLRKCIFYLTINLEKSLGCSKLILLFQRKLQTSVKFVEWFSL